MWQKGEDYKSTDRRLSSTRLSLRTTSDCDVNSVNSNSGHLEYRNTWGRNFKFSRDPPTLQASSSRTIPERCHCAARTVEGQPERKSSLLRRIFSSNLISIPGDLIQTGRGGTGSTGFQNCIGRTDASSLYLLLLFSTASCDFVFTYRLHSCSSRRQRSR